MKALMGFEPEHNGKSMDFLLATTLLTELCFRHVLLNFITSWGKVIKCEACRAFYIFFATSLINSIIQEHEC